MAELLIGAPLFPGESGVDQHVEIIKVLGTPTRQQIKSMNPNYTEFKFPQIQKNPWPRVFRPRTPAKAVDVVANRPLMWLQTFCFTNRRTGSPP